MIHSNNLLSTALYEQLPVVIAEPCLQFSDPHQRELFLLGAIGVTSGMLPNYYSDYFNVQTGTNLFCFVTGRYGTGKGALALAYKLGEAAHRFRQESAEENKREYSSDLKYYKQQEQDFYSGKIKTMPNFPVLEDNLKLYLPGGVSKKALSQLLADNSGNGIIFETEGDTLANMIQGKDDFTDLLRKGFHNEPASLANSKGKEEQYIPRTGFSMVLSGTYDQLLKLIPNTDNGLFSRFMYYHVQSNPVFLDPFSKTQTFNHEVLQQAGDALCELYTGMCFREGNPINFEMTTEQQAKFIQHFNSMKSKAMEEYGDEWEGIVNRMGIICYRIAMTLSILHYAKPYVCMEHKHGPDTITCKDADLEAAMAIQARFSTFTYDAHDYLKEHGKKGASAAYSYTQQEAEQCFKLNEQGMSLRKISALVFGNEGSFMKVKRILNAA